MPKRAAVRDSTSKLETLDGPEITHSCGWITIGRLKVASVTECDAFNGSETDLSVKTIARNKNT